MNARHPLLHGRIGNPVDDATRHDDARQADQDAHESMLAEAEDCAPAILQARLHGLKPGDWFKVTIGMGAMWSPDEMLSWGIEKDDDLKNELAELMTGPAAAKVRQLLAKQFGREYAMDIYLARAEERH